jgi:hypothetical protein
VNLCPKSVRLYYGDNPGDGHGQLVTVDAGATVDVPRSPDGTVVVWVVSEANKGLATVHVTRRMRHVRLDAACTHIDAN